MTREKLILAGLIACVVAGDLRPARAETFTLEDATIDQIQKAMADGALTSVELVSMYLNRSAIYDRSGIKLNSLPVLNPKVLAEAAAADALRDQGTVLGPLHGIPATFKDSYKVKDLSTANGVKAWLDLIANEDADIVKNLRSAGVVMLGKNNLSTLAASAQSFSNAYGEMISPYYGFSFVSGSSGGSAVAVSANLTTLSFGGDTWGSIRQPASVNGVCGFRSTWGLVSFHGTFPGSDIQDVVGPLARSVKDTIYAMDVIAANNDSTNPVAPYLPPFASRRPSSYQKQVLPNLNGKRFGIPKFLIGVEPNNGFQTLQLTTAQAAKFDQARATLVALGAEVVEVDVPLDSLIDPFDFDFKAPADKLIRDDFGQDEEKIISRLDANYFAEVLSSMGGDPITRLQDILSLPSEVSIGGTSTSDKITALQNGTTLRFSSPAILENINLAQSLADGPYFGQWLTANGIDALVFPGATGYFNFFPPGFSYLTWAGAPGLVVPLGVIAEPDDENPATIYNAPMSLYFVGKRFSEDNLMSYALTFENTFKGRTPPPLTPPLPGETIEYSTALPPPSRPELNAPALRVAAGAKVAGKGKKATLVLTGGAVDASGLGSLTVYVNGKKIAAKKAKNWKASVKLAALRSFVKGSAKTVQVTVVAKDVYGNTSVTTKTVKLPKTA